MHRLLILFMSLMVFSSSCAMKKVLWHQLGVESAVPAKQYPSRTISALCADDNGSSSEVAELSPGNAVKVPLILSVIMIVSFASPASQEQQGFDHSHLDYSNTAKVPIYLKLQRLIYYS